MTRVDALCDYYEVVGRRGREELEQIRGIDVTREPEPPERVGACETTRRRQLQQWERLGCP